MIEKEINRMNVSISAAWSGFVRTFKNELNFQIELFLALLAVLISALLQISTIEWALILVAIFGVMTVELINTAFERLSDIQKPRLDPVVKLAKDVSAAAVLFASLGALIIGILVLGPRIASFFAIISS